MHACTGLDSGREPLRKSKLLVLYSCPDAGQEETSLASGMMVEGIPQSMSHRLLLGSFDAMQNILPFGVEDTTFAFALSCRPRNYSDPRKIMRPKQAHLNACRPKWQTELLHADPPLVLLCGNHAAAATDRALQKGYTSYLGEIVDVKVPLGSGTAVYPGYVAPSPEQVVRVCRDDHYEGIEAWTVQPSNHVDEPFKNWLWHFVYACFLAEILHRRSQGDKTTPKGWSSLVNELNAWFDRIDTVDTLLERIETTLQKETELPYRAALYEEQENEDE